jgi:SAM-dependent methyltransferase
MTLASQRQPAVQIDLGCGHSKAPGHIGLDQVPSAAVDIVCDLEQGIPLPSNCVDRVHANHLLEHIQHLDVLMREIYRVCRAGAAVAVRVPYYTSIGAFKDPTHKRFFTEETFLYFGPLGSRNCARWTRFDYGFGVHFAVDSITYTYMRPFGRLGTILPSWAMAPFRRFLWNVVHTMTVEMRVVK